MTRIAIAFVAVLLASCTHDVNGLAIPGEIRSHTRFVVLHQQKDSRHLDAVVAELMRARGLDAVASSEEGPDYVVTYIDRWYWDMRTYLIDFRVDVREYGTNVLVATARSIQDSLGAMGRTHRSVIESVVDTLLAEPAPTGPGAAPP